jgi:hypothetical protein
MTTGAASSLEQQTRAMYARLDIMDLAGLDDLLHDDVQCVDELTRAWLRGRAALSSYFVQLEDMVSDVHTQMVDVHEQVWGDTGVLTFILEQTYTAGGERHALTSPTSVVGRRIADEWKIVLFHSVPLAEDQ